MKLQNIKLDMFVKFEQPMAERIVGDVVEIGANLVKLKKADGTIVEVHPSWLKQLKKPTPKAPESRVLSKRELAAAWNKEVAGSVPSKEKIAPSYNSKRFKRFCERLGM